MTSTKWNLRILKQFHIFSWTDSIHNGQNYFDWTFLWIFLDADIMPNDSSEDNKRTLKRLDDNEINTSL